MPASTTDAGKSWDFATIEDPRNASTSTIVTALVNGISNSRLAPGEKLPPERLLAEMLGVGRSALREALKSLDLLGLIEMRQGDGTYLASSSSSLLTEAVGWGLFLDSADAKQLIDARYFVEGALARLAAERADESELATIWSCVALMERAETPAVFAAADSRFHFAVAAAARNGVLSSVLERAKALLSEWILKVVADLEDRDSIIEQHRLIAERIAARDADGAENMMRAHIGEVTRRLLQEIAKA